MTDCSTQNLLSRFHLIPRQSDPPESSGPFEPFKAIGTFDPFSLLVHLTLLRLLVLSNLLRFLIHLTPLLLMQPGSFIPGLMQTAASGIIPGAMSGMIIGVIPEMASGVKSGPVTGASIKKYRYE